MKKREKNKKDVKISACMMVKNEEEMLPRCLNSIKHLVDEIIVVDTGSTDGTVEIAESFGAKIYHHPWENDFSKHRNQSIGYATGDWFLIIDADEELNAYDVKKKELKKKLGSAPNALHCFFIKLLDKDKNNNITSAAESARIFRNKVGVEYKGIVHNTAYYPGSAGHLDLQLFHYGYALSEEQMQAKYKRTSGLLFKRVEKNPRDHAAYFYLFQVFMEMKEYEDAIGYANQCLDLMAQEPENVSDASFYYSLFHGAANAYFKIQKYEKAKEMVRKGLEIIPDEVDLYYDLAAIGYFTNRPDLIIEGAENYLRVVVEFRTNASRAGTRFVFSTSEEVDKTVVFWLMLAYISTNRIDDFLGIWEKNKTHMIEKPSFQRKLFSTLEEKQAFDAIEKVAVFLFGVMDKIAVENQMTVLSSLLFVLREKMVKQGDGNQKYEQRFDEITGRYLELFESYNDIPVDDAVILAEFLFQKGLSDFFLDLTLTIFDRELPEEIEIMETKEALAEGYDFIAKKREKSRKGQLISLVCLNIAWGLTESKPYMEALEKVKSGIRPFQPKKNASKPETASPGPGAIPFFRTAFVEVDITPNLSPDSPLFLQGMPGEARKATQIVSALKMQILLIEDENHTKLLLVSADLFGFGKEMVQFLNRAVSNWGIPPEGIILNASHTYYAPGTVPHISFLGPYYKKYAMEIAGLINHYLSPLYDSLEATYIYTGKTVMSGGAGCSISDIYKQKIPFFLFKQQKTGKQILLANHGSIPDSYGNENCISADFPGYFREELIRMGRIDHAMYFQGAFRDICEMPSSKNDGGFAQALEAAKEKGRIMARCVQDDLENEKIFPLKYSSIKYTSKETLLPLDAFPDIQRINILKDDPHTPAVIREWASRLSVQYPGGKFPHNISVLMQVVVLGKNYHLISLPVILDSKLGIFLKQMNESSDSTFVLGCTNGLICELPNDESVSKELYRKGMAPYYYMIPNFLSKGIESSLKSSVQQCYATVEKQSRPVTPRNINGEYRDAMKKTIFDYTHYAHQRHPEEELNTDFFRKPIPVAPLINSKTQITSMGSCFARNIAKYLMQNKYNYLVTESPFRQASAHWDQIFNTACMRQIFEYTFFENWNPMVRWWPKDDMVQDPFRRAVLYNEKSCDHDFEKHRESSYNALAKAEVVILTLGLIETWRDRRDKMTFYKVPSPRIYDSNIHEFHVQNTEECIADLNRMHDIIGKNNPKTSFIVTVSPIPLDATFRNDVDIITANMFSKSTLRVAAESFASMHQNAYYFPSYEIITSVMDQPYEKDRRHIKSDAIKEMMEIFKTWFMKE